VVRRHVGLLSLRCWWLLLVLVRVGRQAMVLLLVVMIHCRRRCCYSLAFVDLVVAHGLAVLLLTHGRAAHGLWWLLLVRVKHLDAIVS